MRTLLLERTAATIAEVAHFAVSLGPMEADSQGSGGGVVSSRGSHERPAAAIHLRDLRIVGESMLDEVLFTEASPDSLRILERFPLAGEDLVQVVPGLVRGDGRVLLCHRQADRASYPNVWDLPGGHIEPGECWRSIPVDRGAPPAWPASAGKVGPRNFIFRATRSRGKRQSEPLSCRVRPTMGRGLSVVRGFARW